MRPPDRRRCKSQPTITVCANSTPVPVVSHLRVLGLILQSTVITHTMNKLSLSEQQAAQHDLRRLVNAFVVSRLTYGLPYTRLLKSERYKIDVLIRRAYKTALGLPSNASTDRLLRLGGHNTLDELIEAHRSAQVQRLHRSPTSRHILSSIGPDTSSHPPDLPVGGGASSGPSPLCIICTMMISMIVASAATFFIVNKNRTPIDVTSLTTPSTPKPHEVFPPKNDTGLDGGDLDGAEEDFVTSGDGQSTAAQET
ncbi:hypothetical protein HPB52_021714 [Rhipicephalus sanguineus]|uniref:Transmembrane protein n=1 Tax=Rhipicephalus sanguineus TaxID=34632 RepID=A0A9D4Q8G7_RHISA|nr:hypothetical protein HPB52_021714 [Rhipicephalus sanguineus]